MTLLYQRRLSANSSRYSAAAIPSGTAKSAVKTISQSEPRMPARNPVDSGRIREA